jgi:hypothetical protein
MREASREFTQAMQQFVLFAGLFNHHCRAVGGLHRYLDIVAFFQPQRIDHSFKQTDGE